MNVINSKRINLKKSFGQGMTEYIIIVGVIAVGAIGTFGYFGDAVEHQVAGMAKEISGQSGAAERGLANTAGAQKAADTANNHNGLGNYDDNGQ